MRKAPNDYTTPPFGGATDTIAAISTPLGEGGIGVIRISGSLTEAIVNKIFVKSNSTSTKLKSHQKYHGWIVDNSEDIHIDEAMVCFMKGPKSYTGEDVAEVSCHGGVAVIQEILALIIKNGARLAERGEFTKRAFLNGKIDLSQVEAIIEMIKAKTKRGVLASAQLLKGHLGGKIKEMRTILIDILAALEANIDFEEDVGPLDTKAMKLTFKNLYKQMSAILSTAEAGKILREGIRVAIVGRTNVGKSSLLNALLRESRAIVTEIPGTTRDLIEENINIHGLPVRIVDTAGIRETTEKIEEIGVGLAKDCIEKADLILLVVDLSEPLGEEDLDLISCTSPKKRIIVFNKMDLPEEINIDAVDKLVREEPKIKISALNYEGIAELEELILKVVGAKKIEGVCQEILLRTRHKECLARAMEALGRTLDTLDKDIPLDLVAIDIKEVALALGEVTGEEVTEEVLNKIFDEFCVGK